MGLTPELARAATERRGPVAAAPARTAELITFDVFETVLVRAVSPPEAVFEVVGRRAAAEGLVSCSPQAFTRARVWAETRALRWHRGGSNLAHIHAELAGSLLLDPATRSRLSELEMAVEAELLKPVPGALPLVEEARRRAGRVVWISDMYLPAVFIEEQLARHGFWQPGDVLYVSHTHGQTKRSGSLFRIVAEAEGVPVQAIRHHGNDRRSDVRGATSVGATGVLLPVGNPNRYERALQRHQDSTDGLTAAMAGASRLARLHVQPRDAHEQALVDVAAGVMSPLLVSFVTWILRRAQALGLRKVYFVARDGQVLLRIAERLAPRLGIDVELHYLYASRLVWNRVVSSPSRNPQVWHSLIGLSSDGVSNRDILERCGLAPEVVDRLVAESGVGPEVWASTQDRDVLDRTLEQIDRDGTLAAAAERNKQVVLQYLDSHGVMDGTPHAFVDVGWRGTQHDVLLELQQERGTELARGLFFGLDDSVSPWGDHREAYFFDSRDADTPLADPLVPVGGPAYLPSSLGPQGQFLGISQFALVEIFCSGDHGTLTGYEVTPEGVRPVLTEGRAEAVRAWGLPLVWRTVDAYVEHLAVDADNPYLHVDVHTALTSVMGLFWEWPTDQEARSWAAFPWEVGQGRLQRIVDLAGPFRLRGLAAGVVRAAPSVRRSKHAVRVARRTEWVAASMALSPFPARALLRPRATVRHTLGRAVHRVRAVLDRLPQVRRALAGGS
ncbi:HAD family hydrolase [Aquipuribacter sp. MA13-6]|uniref:HAD family hydrolase n=1 Tax=unclassified Aquipuribacter TaxID=2635084 RepID=UPI003EEC5082